MNRLTWEKSNGDWGVKGYDIKEVPSELYGFFCKLHEYEKTGLKPSEVMDLKEQNYLPKLPCAVGDIVYALWRILTEEKYIIYPAEVKEICIGVYNNRKTVKYILEPTEFGGRLLKFYSDDFSKTVFLTQEQAEAALKNISAEEKK